MGLFNKLMFWKRDELDFDALTDTSLDAKSGIDNDPFSAQSNPGAAHPATAYGTDPSSSSHRSDSAGMSQPSAGSYGQGAQSSFPTPPAGQRGHEMDLISSKLDTIKAQLNSMDQRLASLERSLAGEGAKRKEKLW